MTEHDARYYRDRLSAERTRALEAMTPESSAIHRTLAELYRQRLEEIADGEPSAETGPKAA